MRAVAPGSQDAGRRAQTEKQSHVKRDASCRKPEHREWQKRASGEREAGNAEWPEEGRGGKPPGRGGSGVRVGGNDLEGREGGGSRSSLGTGRQVVHPRRVGVSAERVE